MKEAALSNQESRHTSIETLLLLMRLSEQYQSNAAAITLLLKLIELSFNHTNQTDSILAVIRLVNNGKMEISSRKVDFAPVLFSGFHNTTSDKVRESILHLVSSLRIKPQFKKLLDDDDLDDYKKWAG